MTLIEDALRASAARRAAACRSSWEAACKADSARYRRILAAERFAASGLSQDRTAMLREEYAIEALERRYSFEA